MTLQETLAFNARIRAAGCHGTRGYALHLEAENERLRDALRECARLSGADLSDGFPTWPPLHEFAVQEVKQMREDYDESLPEDRRA